jgi:hypothetical protein
VRVPRTADVNELEVTVRFPGGPLTGEITGWKRLTEAKKK